MPIQLLFVVLAVLFAQSALAQQFYKWKDEKGLWHYSDFLPSGVTAEKMETVDIPQSVSQPFVSSTSGQKKAEDSSDHATQAASDVDPLGSAPRYLLVFPPFDPGKPLSEWIPVQSFDSAVECTRALPIGVSIVENTDFPRETRASVNFGAVHSRCISLAEFKPRKEANVIVAVTNVGSDAGGFSTWVLYGRVFNGGQTYSAERCGEIPGSGRQRDYLWEWRDSPGSAGYPAINVCRVSWADCRLSRRERSLGRDGS